MGRTRTSFFMHVRIECEFMSNETRGSRANKKLSNVLSMFMLWWRIDGLKESIFWDKMFVKSYRSSFSPIIKYKFWGQNFYKKGRNVILEPESKGKLVILYIHAESWTFTCIFCKFSNDNFIKINYYFYFTISYFFKKK